jgi:RNA polymerase sigma factor (sigma-70 family)
MELFYIQQIIEGDLNQFSYFVEKYKDMAFTIAFRIVNNAEDAEEVVQDSFLKAYKSLRQFRGDSKFSTWLFKIVINRSLSKAKRKTLSTKDLDEEGVSDILIEDTLSVYRNLTHADQKKYINQAMGKLNMEDRLLLTLYYLNENTMEEISEITLISRENIKMKLHRARKKMYLAVAEILKAERKNIL